MKFNTKEDLNSPKIFKKLESTISDKNLSKILFAVIICNCRVTSNFTLRQETRDKMSGEYFGMMIEIRKTRIKYFEELIGFKLSEPDNYVLN